MKPLLILLCISLLLCCLFTSCRGQAPVSEAKKTPQPSPLVGGPFENSEYGMIDRPAVIMTADTSPGWNQPGQKLLITGTIYQHDGKTPAADVILYYYHTNTEGRYQSSPALNPLVSRHGYIRGWVKSDKRGKYTIYTVRPGAYPNTNEPAHIHPAVYEPGLEQPYYLDAFVFDDDPLLTTAKRRSMQNRGGSGVLRTTQRGELQTALHDIILGLNIPDYPTGQTSLSTSGPAIGEDLFSFRPYHAWGQDENTRACPVCKYGRGYGVLCFIGPKQDPFGVSDWLRSFESMGYLHPEMKVFFVFAGQEAAPLRLLGQRLNLRNVALTTVPSFTDTGSAVGHYSLDQKLAYTLLIYRNGNVIDRYQGSEISALPAAEIEKSLDRAGRETLPHAPPD